MRKNILALAAALFSVVSFAQNNINPTVEVTNTYQGDPSEVHKPQIGMAIPDSLLRFDMDFGYEVFEKPYQGAYNFKPYMLAMKPDKNAYRGRKLYLKAGAGYSLHPQLDFVFSPEQSGPFQMSVYAGHRSYFGKYNTLSAPSIDGIQEIIRVPQTSFSGYDMRNSFGFEGSYSLPKAIVTFGAGYEGIMAKDTLFRRSLNAVDLNARIRSNRDDEKYVFYDVRIGGRIAGDSWSDNKLSESVVTLEGEAGPVFDATKAALLGFEAETVSYGNLFSTNAGRLALIPKYRMSYGKLDLSLGVRFEVLLKGKVNEPAGANWNMFQHKGGVVFPDVHLRYNATDKLSLFAEATGGNKLNTYSSIISRHHFINPSRMMTPILDNSVEKVNTRIGIEGKASEKLQIGVYGGFALVGNGLMDCGLGVGSQDVYSLSILPDAFLPIVSYADYSMFYADALVDYKIGDFRLDGALHLRNMSMKFDSDFGLALPKVSYDFRAMYDFTSRIYAGVRIGGSGNRFGKCRLLPYDVEENAPTCEVKIPGWFDIGLLGGWQFNRKLAFWLESGNLLCETIQRSPFYSEKDLWITAGITLNL
ncbi:MAG: TonB-dependent receptor [Bacteroidales bacterium]|nr:TonB-dependent receptor [Bacteroidales bacterium]